MYKEYDIIYYVIYMKYMIDGKEYNVIILKKNNKNTYIRIDDDLNILITTNKYTLKLIQNLLDNNKIKIYKMILKKEKELEKNLKFYYLGKNYDIIIIRTFNKVEIIDDKIYVKDLKELNKWLNNRMKEVYLERLDYWYNRFSKIPYPKLKYRNMKTRWGVCNRKNISITLNTNLIKYDIECLDYVIIHELSHFIEFNHSKAFWNIVSKYCNNYKEIRKKLKE